MSEEEDKELTDLQKGYFKKLKKFAKEKGHGDLALQSSPQVRTAKQQKELFDKGATKLDGTKRKSKHQKGLSLDLQFKGGSFKKNLDPKRLERLKKDFVKQNPGENPSFMKNDMGHFNIGGSNKKFKDLISGKTELKATRDVGRSPQSVEDIINKQDSAIQKEGNMAVNDLRPEEESDDEIRRQRMLRSEKEIQDRSDAKQAKEGSDARELQSQDAYQQQFGEEEKTADQKRQEFNANAIKNTPAGQNMSQVQQRKVMKEQSNPENQPRKAGETQEKRNKGEQISTKDNFMEAITFFLPSIVGGVVGHAMGGGQGAAQGVQLGMAGAKDYRQAKLSREKFEQAKFEDAEDRKLKQQVDGAKVAKKQQSADWMTKDKKPTVFDPDRGVYINTKGEVVDPKDLMSSKNHRQAIAGEFRKAGLKQTQINQLAQSQKTLYQQSSPAGKARARLIETGKIRNLINSGAPFKGLLESAMTKGLGGEVGNLTDSERQAAAQIVGFKGQVANLQEYLTSNLSSMRKEEIIKLLDYLEPRIKKGLRKNVKDYASTNAQVLGLDESLVMDYYTKTSGVDFGSDKEKRKVPTDDELDNMSYEELKRYTGGK